MEDSRVELLEGMDIRSRGGIGVRMCEVRVLILGSRQDGVSDVVGIEVAIARTNTI